MEAGGVQEAQKRIYKPRQAIVRPIQREVGGKRYWSLTGVKNEQGRRFRPTFKTRDQAEIWGREYERQRSRLGREGMNLPASVAAEAADCHRRLRLAGFTLRQATDAFLGHVERDRKEKSSRTMAACMKDWLDGKFAERRSRNGRITSDRTVNLYRSRVDKVKSVLGHLPVASVGASHLQGFLEQLQRAGYSSVTRNAYRSLLYDFFNYCYCKEWRQDNPVMRLTSTGGKGGGVAILKVDELEALLDAAEADRNAGIIVPYVALGAFAGLRPEEAQQIRWEDIDLGSARPSLVVHGATSKAREDRQVALDPVAVAWLKRHRRADGPVAGNSGQRFRLTWERVRIAAGWTCTARSRRQAEAARRPVRPWPADCLRHSFASYWLPIHSDRPRLCELMGNTVAVIKKHYRKLVPAEVAAKYWKILPEGRSPRRAAVCAA